MSVQTILLLCLLLLGMGNVFPCELNHSQKGPILSLSAPVTHFLYFLGALKTPQVVAISDIHGIESGAFQGDLIHGGLFISARVLAKYPKTTVFYDENREQKKVLRRLGIQDTISINTIGTDPFASYHQVKEKLSPWLLGSGCEKELKALDLKIVALKEKIDRSPKIEGTLLFFLGEIRDERYPDILMVQDGPVAYLQRLGKITSYPSPLAYVPWSRKILKQLETESVKNIYFLGLDSRATTGQKFFEVSYDVKNHKNKFTINVRGLAPVMPGIAQIYFMASLVDYFSQRERATQLLSSGGVVKQ